MGADTRKNSQHAENLILAKLDTVVNWAHQYSLWPMFFGLSCCFVEQATAFTPRYDIARFGAEVIRGSPRQADLLIVSGTIFKKIAPVILRLYEQMPEHQMGDVHGFLRQLRGDVRCIQRGAGHRPDSARGCVYSRLPAEARGGPARAGDAAKEDRFRTPGPFHPSPSGGYPGKPETHPGGWSRANPEIRRGPGYEGIPIRGTDVVPPRFWDNRSDLMWTPSPRRVELSAGDQSLAVVLKEKFGEAVRPAPQTSDMLTVHVAGERIKEVLRFLKSEATPRFLRLDDLTAIDESARRVRTPGVYTGTVGKEVSLDRPARPDEPAYPDLTLVYHLLSFEPPGRIRLKVPLPGKEPSAETITDIWPSANWYEREVFDMFGIRFSGHPNLRRLIMPHDWPGHPLRKMHPGRATEMPSYTQGTPENINPWMEESLPGRKARTIMSSY